MNMEKTRDSHEQVKSKKGKAFAIYYLSHEIG